LTLLIFSSAYARLWDSTKEVCVILNRRDTPRLKYAAGRIVLRVGEVVLLQLVVHILERAVCMFVGLLGTLADCAWYVAARF
jgi:hypothetical protein